MKKTFNELINGDIVLIKEKSKIEFGIIYNLNSEKKTFSIDKGKTEEDYILEDNDSTIDVLGNTKIKTNFRKILFFLFLISSDNKKYFEVSENKNKKGKNAFIWIEKKENANTKTLYIERTN